MICLGQVNNRMQHDAHPNLSIAHFEADLIAACFVFGWPLPGAAHSRLLCATFASHTGAVSS